MQDAPVYIRRTTLHRIDPYTKFYGQVWLGAAALSAAVWFRTAEVTHT
jgi:hypothetical protein